MANETYATTTSVMEGSPDAAVVTEFTEVVGGATILQLTQADKVVVTVTIPSSDESLQGSFES